MATRNATLRVEGYNELQRAFALADPALQKRLRATLIDAGSPVRTDAEHLASTEIRHVGAEWSRMRVGVTRRVVYVAPVARGTREAKRKRPNMGTLLMRRALEPALDQNSGRTLATVEHMLDVLAGDWERV